MKVIIVGAGNVGIQIARQLIEENRDVVIIERDLEKVKGASNTLDCMVVHGQANNRETLVQSGIEEADFFISVTESDEMNMIACGLVSSEFEVPYKIARVRNLDYSNSRISENTFLGIDYIVNPEIEAARAIVRSVEHGATSDIMYFEDSDFEMRTFVVNPDSFFAGKRVEEIKQDSDLNFIIAVVLRNDDYIIPYGSTEIQPGDTLYIIGSHKVIEALLTLAGKQKLPMRKVIIVGGGRIGVHVTEQLLGKKTQSKRNVLEKLLDSFLAPGLNRKIVIVEENYDKCKQLAERFPDVLVMKGDVSEEGILEEGDLNTFDLLIAATGNQELNLITSLYAKSLGIRRTIALVRKSNFLHIAGHLSVDATISLNNTMVNTILKFIRKGNVRSVHAVSGGKLEILEISCESGCPFAGKEVQELKLPKNTLIMFITRGKESLLPYGQFVIEYGDHIVLITTKESVKKLDKYLDTQK